MISMVDAMSGKIVRLGEKVSMGTHAYNPATGKITPIRAAYRVEGIEVGLLSARVKTRTWSNDGEELGVKVLSLPIHYFPKLVHGSWFPVGGLRAVILPS